MDEQNIKVVNYKKIYIGVGLLALVIIIIGGVFFFQGGGQFSIKTQYPQIYSLVNDKVSVSAPVQINLPKGVAKVGVESNITFDPVLKGSWVPTELASVAVFKPATKLEIGKYYTVTLSTATGQIKKDFEADEDPAIVDIFPKANSEADESSAITIVFNRPMVPLTTLSMLEGQAVPVTITPPTAGKFKWISTRSLQFIPAMTLVNSARYEVRVNPGFVSMDGLAVKGETHKFSTRPLRFQSASNGIIRYNQPIEFRFNQPVDLEKTIPGLVLTNFSTGARVLFRAQYGSRLVYNQTTQQDEKVEDRSIISILPQADKLGRANLWDFENNYTAVPSSAYPVGGDIIFSGNVSSSVTTTGLIQNITAQSDRTDLVSPELFDPQGKVTISFYEDIDLNKSDISAKGLDKVVYGEKCKKEDRSGENYYDNTPCEKVSDQATLIFSFKAGEFTNPGEPVPLHLKRIVSVTGIVLTTKEMIVPLTVYPPLQIKKITPADGATDGSLTQLTICTNSPLAPQTGKAFSQAIKADQYIVLGRWGEAYRQTVGYYNQKPPCAVGDFVNVISYGLLPDKPYTFKLSLADVFGQTVQKQLSFSTTAVPDSYMHFQSLDKI